MKKSGIPLTMYLVPIKGNQIYMEAFGMKKSKHVIVRKCMDTDIHDKISIVDHGVPLDNEEGKFQVPHLLYIPTYSSATPI